MRKILSIGINYVGSDAELSGCVNDSKNLMELLEKKYKASEIAEICTLWDEEATRAHILEAFGWLVDGVKSGDKLLFHYSGHGGRKYDRSGDEKDHFDETLVPNDYLEAGEILDDEVRSVLINKIPYGVTLHVIMDCCHSKTMCDLRYSYKFEEDYVISSYDRNNRRTNGNIIVISGCEDDDYSADSYEYDIMSKRREAQGAMSMAFIRVFNKGKITYENLIPEMRYLLECGGYTQVVQLTSGRYIDMDAEIELL